MAGNTITVTPDFNTTYADYIKFKTIEIPSGKNNNTFRVGVRIDIPIQKLLVEWIVDSSSYIPIRPIFFSFVRTSGVLVNVDNINSVTSGGRSKPIYVTVSRAPFDTLSVYINIFGYLPKYASIYPTVLDFADGKQTDCFWVSVGAQTKQTSGEVIFFMKGPARDVFYFPERTQTFIISKPDMDLPFAFASTAT